MIYAPLFERLVAMISISLDIPFVKETLREETSRALDILNAIEELHVEVIAPSQMIKDTLYYLRFLHQPPMSVVFAISFNLVCDLRSAHGSVHIWYGQNTC